MNNKIINPKVANIYSLTPLQEGMLYHSLVDNETSSYVLQSVYHIKGEIEEDLIIKALDLLARKYDVLRTAIIHEKISKSRQIVLKDREIEFEKVDLSNLNEVKQRAKISEIAKLDVRRGFDLQKDTLMRMKYIVLSNESSKLIWSMHHIIVDGWCMSILFGDFMRFYDSLKSGRTMLEMERIVEEQKRETAEYGEYIKWLEQQDREEGLTYWKGLLSDYDSVAEVQPMCKPEPYEEQVEQVTISIPKETSVRLQQLAAANNVTVNNVVEAAWGVVLQRYNRTKDVVFGKVVSGRNADIKGIDKIVGLFINTIPFRVKCEETTTVPELLKELRQQGADGNSYDYCSLAEIQSQTRQKSDLIKTLYVFENYYVDEENLNCSNRLQVAYESAREQTNYAISLIASVKDKGLNCKILYNPNEYAKAEIEMILKRMEKTLLQIAEKPDMKVSDIDVITETEKELIVHTFHNTVTEYPKDKTVVDLFEEQVRKTPEHIALVFEDETLTYQELNRKANQLARKLRALGVKPDDFVVIIAERSIEMVVGIYGIIKAGGAYVPIDPTYPEDRITYMLEDCSPKVLLVYKQETEIITELPVIDLADSKVFEGVATNLKKVNKPEDLIYCIFTSGTTGKPKGVMIEHRNVVRLFKNNNLLFDFNESDVWIMFHSYCFDFSVWEMYGASLFGGQLIILSKKSAQDSFAVMDMIRNDKVTVLNQVPSAFYNLLEADKENNSLKLRYVIFGGEALSPQRLIKWHQRHPDIRIVNMYGITETTVHVTYMDIKEAEIEHGISNIGSAIPTLSVYIKNEDQLCGIGMPGELCVAGAGLARGYLNQPELTAEKFVDNPFGEGKLYCSGDLARWLPDGNIEYLGRIDEQVKIRGFRIELGEIENVIRKIDKVRDVAVITREDHGDKAINAYVVSEEEISVTGIRDTLSKSLPEYMIPAFIMQIEKLPVTGNGKLDKKALPKIEVKSEKEYTAPRNEKEEKITRVFEEILGIAKVGVKDSFFELGGDSIKAIRIVSKIREAGYDVSVKDIMKKYTVEAIADSAESTAAGNNAQNEVTGTVLTTPILELFEAWELKKPHHFNQAVMIKVDTNDENEVITVLHALAKHHDILRSVYRNKVLEILSMSGSKKFDFGVFDYSNEIDATEKIEYECTKQQSTIDLEHGPLMKAAFFKTNKGNFMMLCLHHLVVDGVSWRILTEDFHTALCQLKDKKAIVLPPKTASYQEWGVALAEYRSSKNLQSEKEYWRKVTSEMLYDQIREDVNCRDSGYRNIDITFSKTETDNLVHKAGKAFHTEINDLLLSAIGRSIKQLTGQEKVTVGLEGHGREEIHKKIDIDRTVGWFTSIYPILLECKENISDCIIFTKEMLRKVPNHGMGYGLLKNEFSEMNASLYFNYLGEIDAENKEEYNVSYSSGISVAKENRMPGAININGFIRNGQLSFALTYETSKYLDHTMNHFSQIYKASLSEIVEYCIIQNKSIKTAADFEANDLTLDDFGLITNLL